MRSRHPRGCADAPCLAFNLVANPDEVAVQDGAEPFEVRVRQLSGSERDSWWERAVAAYPPHAEYQAHADREIPVFVAARKV